jgi:hypothetical protein
MKTMTIVCNATPAVQPANKTNERTHACMPLMNYKRNPHPLTAKGGARRSSIIATNLDLVEMKDSEVCI